MFAGIVTGGSRKCATSDSRNYRNRIRSFAVALTILWRKLQRGEKKKIRANGEKKAKN